MCAATGGVVFQARYTLKQLEYFVATAEAGTLKAAAERCHVSHVGIGIALTELERALGIQLFVRRRAKGVSLTPAGRRALAEARTVLSFATELQLRAEAAGGQVAGSLKVGYHPGLGPFYLPEILDVFARSHPRLTLSFHEGTQPELERRLLDGDIEVALLYERRPGEGLDLDEIARLRPYVLLAADHPLAAEPELSLADLEGQQRIRLSIPLPDEDDFAARSGEELIHTSNLELVRSLVGRGLGYALLAQRPPDSRTYDGREVVSRPLRDATADIAIVMAHASGAPLTRRATALRDFCRTIAA
ncbi:LysR substrate-binding domain-containing protein [Microbacterium album]|uniref:Transcriptional regulator n=1 Tax=Microbacterium album TaxID=2053191 RepID=A0A917MLV6_9MICO|nr:LysR substrate-binding domain-containing protein [Microbacterium album]GGH44742.1 transcriptional regulator [Microbacterium album]